MLCNCITLEIEASFETSHTSCQGLVLRLDHEDHLVWVVEIDRMLG